MISQKQEHDSVTPSVQIALDALLTVYTDQDWQQSFSSLANKVTAVGPSHRAHLVALKFLPAHSPRGFALQQAAAASLLQGLCTLPSKVCSPDFTFISYTPVLLPNVQWTSGFQWNSGSQCSVVVGVCRHVVRIARAPQAKTESIEVISFLPQCLRRYCWSIRYSYTRNDPVSICR